jgi:peptidoglycan/xylan/chitin deacetylase (PgdA/CDA1 family)
VNLRPHISIYFLLVLTLILPLILLKAFHLLVILGILSGVFFFIPAILPNSPFFEVPITSFKTDQKEVWITIDDGPHPIDTPQILEILDRYQAKATFFVIGTKVLQHPDLIREIVQRGHSLGNHTFSHPIRSFWIALSSRLQDEIDRCSAALQQVSPLETPPSHFRAPVGMTNYFLPPLLKQRNLRLIGWSARGYDTMESDPEKIVGRILKTISPGTIILLHEGHHQEKATGTNPKSLDLLLQRLKTLGYAAVLPSSQHLNEP